ncbi:hypothetical protein ACHWQZ_G004790 [Mnemiopsis leidyi]
MAAEAEAPLLTESPDIYRTPSTEDSTTSESSTQAFPQATTLESPVISLDPPSYADIWTEALIENPAALTSAAEDIPTYAEVFPDVVLSNNSEEPLDAAVKDSPPADNGGYVKTNLFTYEMRRCISPTVLVRKIVVTATLMLATQCMLSISMINSGFLAVHLTGRNISGTVYGIVGSGIGIGFLIAPFFGIFNRLHHGRGISHHTILMGIMLLSLLKCLCYGISDMISHKMIFAGASIFLRIMSGVSIYVACFTVVDAIRNWFPENFQLVNSLVTGTASYVGYGIFSFVGAISYEDHGHHAPYLILGCFTLFAMFLSHIFLPRDNQPISSFHSLQEKPPPETNERADPLTPLIYLPILGQYLINMTSGYCVLTSVPFLMECCGVSSARASSLIFTNSLAVAVGFIIAGIISQRRTLTENTQSMIGCGIVITGTLFLFPSPSLQPLYSSSHYTGYLAITLLGLGDPLVTNVTIQSMEQMQTIVCGRSLNSHQKNSIASIWLVGWVGGVYSGTFLAGMFLDHLTFTQGTLVMVGVCLLAVSIFAILKVIFVLSQKRAVERVQPAMNMVAICEIEYV